MMHGHGYTLNTKPLLLIFLQLIRTIGAWTFGCIALSFIIIVIAYFRVGAVVNTNAMELVNSAGKQRMLTERIAKEALNINLAIMTQSWDSLDPALEQLKADSTAWREAHDSLSHSPENTFQISAQQNTVQSHFDQIEYPKSQISQAVDEIEIVTRSVIRRAPYIDAHAADRISAATQAIQANEPGFIQSMNQIVALYEINATASAKNAAWALRKSLWFLVLMLTLAFAIGVAPRYWFLVAKNTRLEDDMKRANEAANKRWHFLASLGHEFRTPMSSIMGFAGLLANEDQDSATKKQHANSILGPSRELMGLIEDIIDMSAIEANNLQVFPKATDPRSIFNELESVYKTRAEEKNIEFRTFFDDSCPASIITDDKRLNQILHKILKNAIKFTKTGFVEMHAALETLEDKEMFVIRIVDSGIGIDFKDINRIFEPFEAVETGMTREHGGAGLGLTVASALTQRLGGDLTIESALGAGCFVTIAIDPGEYTVHSIESHEPSKDVEVDLSILESKFVLLVEDGEDNQRLISHFLTKAGCIIKLAENGQIGIDRYMENQKTDHPIDLILMDMQMPVLDGFEATAILREEGATIPIIGVTAHASEDDRQRCLNAGCDEYLAKPVKKSLLLDTCALWLAMHADKSQDNDQQSKQAA